MSRDELTCDLPGCGNSAPYADGEDADEEWVPNPPPGWIRVVVSRHDARRLTYDYCSHEHMLQGLRDLPAPEPHLGRQPPSRWADRFYTTGCLVAALVVAGIFILGLLAAVGLLLDH